jgi:hypothetical protein
MKALAQEGCAYRGFLYFGLMLTATGPKVLEFNCRLGDPEAQAIVARMDFDLGEALSATVEGRLASQPLKWHSGASVCVVMASEGYPGKYATGREITGFEKAASLNDVSVLHAGKKRSVISTTQVVEGFWESLRSPRVWTEPAEPLMMQCTRLIFQDASIAAISLWLRAAWQTPETTESIWRAC